jgi:dTDP-glucose pyrophosphorylase
MTDDFVQTFLTPQATILDAIGVIDRNEFKVGLVVDSDHRLLGVVTDGDVRRGILKGIPTDAPVTRIMNPDFKFARPDDEPGAIFRLMKKTLLRHIPLLDQQRRVIGLRTLADFVTPRRDRNWVVIMAGGLGTRLRPLTEDCPKPMLPVGDKPILEHIVDRFASAGFSRIFIAVNYKSHMIESHFGDGSPWGVTIEYLYETKALGTIGAVSLLPRRPERPVVVMNGDLMTKVPWSRLIDFHEENGRLATVGVREYDFQVPYGVVEVDGPRLTGLVEKPVEKFFVNAGIYVLEPEVLDLIPKGEHFDVTTLLNRLIHEGRHPAVFPIREYWIDVGRMEDYVRANADKDQEENGEDIGPDVGACPS